MDPPSGRVSKQGLERFLVATEACGGGTPDLGYVLEVWRYIRSVGIGNKSRGVHEVATRYGARPGGRAHPLISEPPRGSSDVNSKSPG